MDTHADWPQLATWDAHQINHTAADQGPPRILVTVPSMEGWDTVVELLQRTGAQITDRRREFAITAALSIAQAAALAELARYQDAHGDRVQIRVVGVAYDKQPPGPAWWDQQMSQQRQRRGF